MIVKDNKIQGKQGKHAAGGSAQGDGEAKSGAKKGLSGTSAPSAGSANGHGAPSAADVPFDLAASAVPGAASFGMEASAAPKRKHGKVVAIVLGAIVAVALVAYLAGAFYFSNRFFPNTTAGKLDISLQTVDDVRNSLDKEISDYELVVSGQGFRMELTSQDAGVNLDAESVVASMHEDANMWLWPYEVFRTHDEAGKLAASYNESGLEEAVRAAVDQFNADKQAPVNATIAFSDQTNRFEVVPEQAGTAVDADRVVRAVDMAVVALEDRVDLTADDLQQPTVLSTEPALQEAADRANTMITADVTLTMAGDVAAEVNAALISQWIALDENLQATLNQDALTAWVDELTAQCNTVGTSRSYTRADGKQITVSGGVYGWEVDRDALLAQVQEAVNAGAVGEQAIPTTSSGDAYNGAGQRDWGNRYCDIDLSEQHVRFYDESGALVWESDCISGTPDGEHDTPAGVYWVNQKESPSMLIGYEDGKKIYESEVQYWMPFVGNSIGLHDANWQPDFGGSMYAQGYGSHGCVNLPVDKAAQLYGIIQAGDCVVCHW